jgi:hypothetical protein
MDTPAAAAALAWRDQVQLPSPGPYIAPGRAITGKTAYLELRDATSGAWALNAFGYTIGISATSTYDIDWGDGSWSNNVTSAGGPWPDGDVTHVYTNAGHPTIVVYQHWLATWTVDGSNPQTIADIRATTGSIPNFPVEQVQAVIER